MLEKPPTGKYLVYAAILRLLINITQLHSKNNYCECIDLGCSRCSRPVTSLRRANLVRSEDSSSGESEEEEEAGRKYVVKYTLLSPPVL